MTALLNAAVIHREQHAARLTTRRLAALTGFTLPRLTGVLNGTNHREVTVNELHRLAAALNVTPADLLTHPTHAPTPEPPPEGNSSDHDAQAVGALLHNATALTPIAAIADALGWTTDRARQALDILACRLPAAGLRLHRLHDTVAVRPDDNGTLTEARQRLTQSEAARKGLPTSAIRVLHHAATNPARLDRMRQDPQVLVELARLQRLGAMDSNGNLTADTQWALGLTGPPPHIN